MAFEDGVVRYFRLLFMIFDIINNMEDLANSTKIMLEDLKETPVAFPWNKPSELECIELTVERLLRNKEVKNLKIQQGFIDIQQRWIIEQQKWIDEQKKYIDEQQKIIFTATKKIIENKETNDYVSSNKTEKPILDYSSFIAETSVPIETATEETVTEA